MTASEAIEFDRHVPGKNIITPTRIRVDRLDGNHLVELTTGTGMPPQRLPLFGVTVLDRSTGKLRLPWSFVAEGIDPDDGGPYSQLFRSRLEAEEWIAHGCRPAADGEDA